MTDTMNDTGSLSIVPQWLWFAFSIGILLFLCLDIGLLHRRAHKTTVRDALLESAFWVSLALAFNAWFAIRFGQELGVEFLTGYLVEKSLSVDNLFIILLVFGSFRVPAQYQHRVLFFGILGAIVMRGALILVGAQLIHRFHWILYIFGLILIVTAVRFLFEKKEKMKVESNWSIRIVRKFVPLTSNFDGQRFVTVENGARKGTPLLMALIVIEATDLIFAVDSIPAVFAVTQDAFVAFASNILALLGLRALYFVIADWVSNLRYLKSGLAAVLAFIGIKMLIADFFKIPSWISLLAVICILALAALASVRDSRRQL